MYNMCCPSCFRILKGMRRMPQATASLFTSHEFWSLFRCPFRGDSPSEILGIEETRGASGNPVDGASHHGVDGIVPVPVTRKTLKERGFNQTLLLSDTVSRHFKIPVHMDLLNKKKDTLPQIGLGARERINNIKNVFEVKGRINKMRLILLDDVMTTGATVRECSKVLMKAGAEEVVVVTLARSILI